MGDFVVVGRLAEMQHGVVSRAQLRQLGIDRWALARWRDAARVEVVTPRVIRAGGSAPTALQHGIAAMLDAGEIAVASHFTAAWLWRLPGFDFGRFDATVLRADDTRAPRIARLHRPRLLLPHHVTSIENIPVTSLARTIFDLAGQRVPMARLDRLVNTVMTRSPAMGRILHRTLDELAERGRPGITVMRALLRDHPPGQEVPASGLEGRFEEVLRNAGVTPLDRQVNAGGEEWIGRIDFCDRSLALLVEVDSTTYHSSVLDKRLDALRDEALLAAGWRKVVRVSEDDLWHRPWIVVDEIRKARRELLHAA